MKRIILTATLSLAALSAVTATAQQTTPQNGTRIIKRVEARLGITPAQVIELKAILEKEKPTLQSIHTQLSAEHAELLQLTTFNEAQTDAILARYASANTAQLVEREKLRCEITAIMTPAQQQKLEQLRSRFGPALDDRLQTLGDKL